MTVRGRGSVLFVLVKKVNSGRAVAVFSFVSNKIFNNLLIIIITDFHSFFVEFVYHTQLANVRSQLFSVAYHASPSC